MNLSFQVVPWYDVQEWHEVYNKLFAQTSTLETKISALEDLFVWKARCPSLPSGIESTLTLIEVHIQELRRNDLCGDHLLRLAMSSALMRFVNHMLDAETVKGVSFYQAAKNSGIPDWVIDLRHDTAHNCRLPSFELLRDATSVALDWLKYNYWNKHKQCIANLVVGKLKHGEDIEDKIAVLLNFCISLGICSHSNCKIKYVKEITDSKIQESLINDAKYLFDGIDFSNMNLHSVKSLIEVMFSKSKKLLSNEMVSKYVNKYLLSEESLFLSLELHTCLDNFNLNCYKSFNKQYVDCFKILLNFLHTNNLLQNFILELIKFTQSEDNSDKKRTLASQWLSTIFGALRQSQLFIEKIYETDTQDWSMKDKKEIYSLFYHWFPNKKKSFLLDLRKTVPQDFTDITFIQPIISTYNPHLIFYIFNLLTLVQPPLPDHVIKKICTLAEAVAFPKKISSIPSQIYTFEDIKVKDNGTDASDDDVQEVTSVVPEPQEHVDEESDRNFGIWERASNDYDWSKCPIGQLPWQQNEGDEPMDVESNQ